MESLTIYDKLAKALAARVYTLDAYLKEHEYKKDCFIGIAHYKECIGYSELYASLSSEEITTILDNTPINY